MKEVLKEEIGIWKENLKAVIYIFVLDLSGTVTRAVKSGVNDIWTIGGFLSLFGVITAYILVWKKISGLLKLLKEVDDA
jgi:hypothetical protein